MACRCAAVNTLYHILAAHGHTAATKQELLTAQGLTTLVQVMVRTTLPLAARAAAAGCLYHYLAPLPHQSGTLQQAAAAADAAAAGRSAAPAAVSKPSSSPAATKSIIQQALQKRRQQHAGELRSGSPDGAQQQALQSDRPSTSKSSPTATGIRYEEGAGDAGAADAKATKRAVATAAVEWALPPAPGDTAAALATAQHEALLAHWDLAARRGLAACAEHVVGGVGGLL